MPKRFEAVLPTARNVLADHEIKIPAGVARPPLLRVRDFDRVAKRQRAAGARRGFTSLPAAGPSLYPLRPDCDATPPAPFDDKAKVDLRAVSDGFSTTVPAMDAIGSVMQAKQDQVHALIGVAVLRKQIEAVQVQGDATIELLQAATEIAQQLGKGLQFDARA